MPVFKVNVKWGKEKFSNIECNTDEPPLVFKAQLFGLSGVHPERQKVMLKGGTLKDDDWGNAKIKDGMTLMMMGSGDDLPTAPVEKTKFIEDMTDQQLANAMEVPAGLNNLGNTCYMNATLQCLRAVPELKEQLKKYKGNVRTTAGMMDDQSITAAVRDLFSTMDQTSSAIPPIIMLNVLHMRFPHFADKNEQGTYQQQDANECWTQLVRCLQKNLPAVDTDQSASAQGAVASSDQAGFIDQYMGGKFSYTMKCTESEEEPVTKGTETFYQLSCFIEKEVKYLHTGLKSKLEETIEKNSPILGANAKYLKSSRISRLPGYLAIQMVRFYYKEKEQVNAKILKDIKFPMSLDLFDLCDEETQQKLIPARGRFKALEDLRVEKMSEIKAKGDQAKKQNLMPTEKKIVSSEPYSFPDDPGSNNSGYYELKAVLTHKGRSSSSGHYVAWVHRKGDDWLMFDDENVTLIQSEDILKLSGGGDWHCAYVLLYGPRVLELEEGEVLPSPEEASSDSPAEPMDTTQS